MPQRAPALANAQPQNVVDAGTMVRRKEHFQRYANDTRQTADQLATRLMLPPARIGDLLSGRAPISNELATHIEEMLQLPASWLDQGGALEQGEPPMIDAVERPMRAASQNRSANAADKKQINENRRLNLTMLTSARGTKNRLAQLAGTSGSRISLMTTARKPVSDTFAFAIEDGLGLPRGWLDQPRTPAAVPAAAWELLHAEAAAEPPAAAAPAPVRAAPVPARAPAASRARPAAPSAPLASSAPLPPPPAGPVAAHAASVAPPAGSVASHAASVVPPAGSVASHAGFSVPPAGSVASHAGPAVPPAGPVAPHAASVASHAGSVTPSAAPHAPPAAEILSAGGTGLFDKSAGQCGPIAEALAKTILNLSAADKLSEARAFQILGALITETAPTN